VLRGEWRDCDGAQVRIVLWAEREGFEPPVLIAQLFSRQPP
jgi:hypothetical protein